MNAILAAAVALLPAAAGVQAAGAREPLCSGHFCLQEDGLGDPKLLDLLEKEYLELQDLPPRIQVALHEDYDSFRKGSLGTGLHAARWRGRTLHLAPLHRLEERGILRRVVRHELTHLWVHRLSRGRAPRWLAEGVCVWRSGELDLQPRADEKPVLRAGPDSRITYRQAGEWVRAWLGARPPHEVERLLRQLGEGRALEDLAGRPLPEGPGAPAAGPKGRPAHPSDGRFASSQPPVVP